MPSEPSRQLRLFALLAPGAVLALYIATLVVGYAPYVGRDLQVRNVDGLAIADVLPFGFVLPWLVFALLFAFTAAGALAVVPHRLRWAGVLLLAFALCSAGDWFLFGRVLAEML